MFYEVYVDHGICKINLEEYPNVQKWLSKMGEIEEVKVTNKRANEALAKL